MEFCKDEQKNYLFRLSYRKRLTQKIINKPSPVFLLQISKYNAISTTVCTQYIFSRIFRQKSTKNNRKARKRVLV